ncbi:MAG: tagaturonate epimerase family protein [Fermentimonas sp.]|nr:tagaturonate epimerase family protein [Fermentimonas sp.]
MKLEKFSIGIGDRFLHQGEAQLRAIMKMNNAGYNISPVWNKSNREHIYVGSVPADTRVEADEAVKALNFKGSYFVDADHINLETVGKYIDTSNFFTLDVASFIGIESSQEELEDFILSCRRFMGQLHIPGLEKPLNVTADLLKTIAGKFLAAAKQASDIYMFLKKEKGEGNFITEVSMDEVESPQTPVELFFILKMLAEKSIPVQTIAPKFTGRFNKGVDYVGDLDQFALEFEQNLLIIDFAVKEFGLPAEIKLSVHSGSDKFTIYPIMANLLKMHDKGLHLKTAGTTWLEEVIGLSLGGEDSLTLVKEIYKEALHKKDILCAPYADVIDIDDKKLPKVSEVETWTGQKFADTLRHIPGHPDYNPDFRQLIHVAYSLAATMGTEYTDLLKKYADIIGQCVEENIYERHLKRLFAV